MNLASLENTVYWPIFYNCSEIFNIQQCGNSNQYLTIVPQKLHGNMHPFHFDYSMSNGDFYHSLEREKKKRCGNYSSYNQGKGNKMVQIFIKLRFLNYSSY